MLDALRDDPTLRFTESGRAMLRWLGLHVVDDRAATAVLGNLPPHCADAVAAVARHNARFWERFAERLDELADDPVLPRPRLRRRSVGDPGCRGARS